MESIDAALLLSEGDAELNEANLTSLLEVASHPVTESRTRALDAALEGPDIDVDRIPAHTGTGTARETAVVEGGYRCRLDGRSINSDRHGRGVVAR